MQESWHIESCYTHENFLSNQNGEALNYHKNLEQKLINTITLPFVFNSKKNTYSNFTYNKDGSKLAIIIKDNEKNNFELIIYIPFNYLIEYEQKLNSVINKENYRKFILFDERNILHKLFGNLTFLRLSQNTNNLYFLSENEILLTSLDRKIFIFIKLDEKNEYKTENEDYANDDENIIEDNIIVKNLEDIIYTIKKNYIDLNLKLSFINKNIDNLINNSIPKNIYLDLSLYSFCQNFFLLVDHNKIILIFYIENNTDNKQYILIFFLNYNYTGNKDDPLLVEEDQKMTLEFPINSNIKTLNILSITAKIKTGYLVICLSFKDNQFQIILVDMQLRIFKKYISKIFYVPTKRKGNITVITDLFIYEKYAFIIFDFYYIIIFNLTNFGLIPIFTLDNNVEKENKYINIKDLFPKEYNKTFFIEFENVFTERQIREQNNNNSKGNNNIGYLYLNTKKNTKEIIFNITKVNQTTKLSKNLLSIFRVFNKKQSRYITNIISVLNENELYTFLHFISNLQKYSKNAIFMDNYLFQIIYIIDNKIKINLFENLKSKGGCIKNLLLLKYNKYFGIYNSFIRYNFFTIKFISFIENEEENSINNDFNYLYEHKIMMNNNKQLNLNDYFLSISNNYLIIYQIITIIILLIKYENKINSDLLKLYIKPNFITNNYENRKFILNKFKLILNKLSKKKVENIFNINKISFYSTKKKILSEIRKSLMNIDTNNKNKNASFILFESVFVILSTTLYKDNVVEYSFKEIKFIKFILYIISFYLNQIIDQLLLFDNNSNVKMNLNIYNLYNLNDILYSLDYSNISFEDIYSKYFIKNISLKLNNSDLNSTKELFLVLLMLKMIISDEKNKKKILEFLNEYNNIEKNNLVIDPIFFLLLLLNNKESQNINKNIKDNISKLIIKLIEKRIEEAKHNKIFKLIFLFIDLINNNNNFNKELFLPKKIMIKYLEKEITLFEKENISMFNNLFKIKNNKRNYNFIKYKNANDKEEEKNINKSLLINLIKKKKNPPLFINQNMNDKCIYIFSIIRNIIDIFLFILNQIKENNKNNIQNNNLIEILLESKNISSFNLNRYSYINEPTNNKNEDLYYSIENITKIFQKFCFHLWIFNSLFIFIEEMNKKYISDNSKEIILISLLHIHFYYSKKYPNESPILKKEIIQYLNYYFSSINKQGNIISIKMKNIIEMYMDKELLYKHFKDIFKDKINNLNIFSSKQIINNEMNEVNEMYNYIKINDIQFDIYLNQFKTLFLDDKNELLKCQNDYIININSKIKSTKFYKKGQNIFNKYNKLIKYSKLIEIIGFDVPLHKNIKLNDIYVSKDNSVEYNPQILFSIRKSLEQLCHHKDVNDVNNYIEIIQKGNISSSDNNTTIINNNTFYSFNNNANSIKKEEEKNSMINNEDIKIEIKQKSKFKNKTLAVDLDERNNKNNYNNLLYKSENLDEFMKRIKDKKNFNYFNDYNDDEIRYKYLAAKLLIKYFINKKAGMNFFIFKNLKALYYVNQKNKIENQINIFINEEEND